MGEKERKTEQLCLRQRAGSITQPLVRTESPEASCERSNAANVFRSQVFFFSFIAMIIQTTMLVS